MKKGKVAPESFPSSSGKAGLALLLKNLESNERILSESCETELRAGVNAINKYCMQYHINSRAYIDIMRCFIDSRVISGVGSIRLI